MKIINKTNGTITATVKYDQKMVDIFSATKAKIGEELRTTIMMYITKGDLNLFCRDTAFFYNVEGDKGVPDGAKARFSDGYIGAAASDLMTEALAEARADMIAEPTLAPTTLVFSKPERGAGWCNVCHSYCFGDCQS